MSLDSAIGNRPNAARIAVIIGGLFSATLLTLIVLPVLYASWFGRSKVLPNTNTQAAATP